MARPKRKTPINNDDFLKIVQFAVSRGTTKSWFGRQIGITPQAVWDFEHNYRPAPKHVIENARAFAKSFWNLSA